jgi:hypothetical protein
MRINDPERPTEMIEKEATSREFQQLQETRKKVVSSTRGKNNLVLEFFAEMRVLRGRDPHPG